MPENRAAKIAEPFVCGGTAATMASIAIHPMDLAKVSVVCNSFERIVFVFHCTFKLKSYLYAYFVQKSMCSIKMIIFSIQSLCHCIHLLLNAGSNAALWAAQPRQASTRLCHHSNEHG